MIGPVTGGETFWRRVTDLVIHTRVRRVWEQGDHLKNVAESVGR
jgi:hypothetical protein